VPKAFRIASEGRPWMFKLRRTYNEAHPDQPQARQSSKKPVRFRADWIPSSARRDASTAAPSHAFEPTDCTGFCTDCLHLVPTGGCCR
jgi:hypothetical protein